MDLFVNIRLLVFFAIGLDVIKIEILCYCYEIFLFFVK